MGESLTAYESKACGHYFWAQAGCISIGSSKKPKMGFNYRDTPVWD